MSVSVALVDLAIDRFWETIPPFWSMVRNHVRGLATASSDLTVEQFRVLRLIRGGATSVSELADAKRISRPAISQAVEVLVKKGLLTRVQSARDRRFVQLALTTEGDQLLAGVFEQTRDWMKQRLQALDARELETVAQAMEALSKMLDEPTA
jgi:DNA-binding MarR family transcriptional regulator